MVSNDRGLARFVNTPAGLTAREAQNFARLKLDMLREKSLAEIDDSLDGLGGYIRLLKNAVPPNAVEEEMHRLSCSILNLAGTFGLDALGRAAFSLCTLLDERNMRGHWDRVAVDVHLDAMRLLRQPETISQSMQSHLLDGLRKVVNHADSDTAG